MQIRRLGFALGAEITGIDLTGPLSDEVIAQIRAAWMENIVLCIPGQDLTPEQLTAFARRFGDVNDNRQSPQNRHPDFPEVMALSNKPVNFNGKMAGGYRNGDAWHTDLSYTDHPVPGSFLVAKQLPEVGGNTGFASMYAAYESLSPAFREAIEGLGVVHDLSLGPVFAGATPEIQEKTRKMNPPIVHRLVRVHPETGRKCLYLSERVRLIDGMTVEESRPLLDYLLRHSTAYEFVYRHTWTVHDLVMWDNRCAMHIAIQDYDQSELRSMIRSSLLGPRSGKYYDPDGVRETASV